MELCCDICGDIGYKEALIRCSQCNINIEHMYCMRVVLIEPPCEWYCEDCKPVSTTLSAASNLIEELSKSVQGRQDDDASSSIRNAKQIRNLGWQKAGPVREKKVETGKTKFLSSKEVVALNSGTNKTVPQRASAIKTTSHFTPSPTAAVPNRAFPEQIAGASGSSLHLSRHKKVPFPKVQRMRSIANINTSTPPSVTVLPNRVQRNSAPEQKLKRKEFGNMELPEVRESQSRKRTEVQRQASRNEDWIDDYMQKKEPSVRKSQQTREKNMKERSLASSPSLIAPPGFNSSGVNGGNHLKLLPDASKFISNVPATDVLWKGTSNIWDTSESGKFIIDLQANPSAQIRRKVYELSKSLPRVINFNLVPSKKYRDELFANHSPDRRDIGLYFFRHDTESPDSYTSLVNNIIKKDLALRALITADAELMVFPSTCFLARGQYWEGKFFLWGIFHGLKGDEITTLSIDKGKKPLVDENYGGGTHDDDDDMELDMVGGVAVGVTDVVATKEKEKKKKQIVEVKLEKPNLGIPPGFEHKFAKNRAL